MKHSRRRPAGYEPDILLAEGRNTGAAGGKSSFTGQSVRHLLDHNCFPVHPVRCRNKRKLAINRVTHRDAMSAVPEGKAVIKRIGIFVGELELPGLAAVRGLVNP